MKIFDTIMNILIFGIPGIFILLIIIFFIKFKYMEIRDERRRIKLIKNILEHDSYQERIRELIEIHINQRRNVFENERVNTIKNKLNSFKFLNNKNQSNENY
jgi:hypothetical protein